MGTVIKLSKLSEKKRIELAETTDDSTVLWQLTEDSSWKVKVGILRNPTKTKEMVQKLSKDEDNDVREAVACWDDTPKDILIQLYSTDYDYEVKGAAETNLKKRFNF